MTKEISLLLGELKSRLNAYVGLMGFRFSNLCVKSDPVAMLPIAVEINGEPYYIEDTCDITQPNEFQLMLYPKSEDLINQLSRGVLATHPEMKQERMAMLDDDTHKVVPVQDVKEGDKVAAYCIRLTMPTVNKDRHDVLTDSVKLFYDDTMANIDGNCAAYTERIPVELQEHPNQAEEIEAAKEALKKLRSQFEEQAKKIRDEKTQEIEDAYQKYLADKSKIQQEQEEQLAEEEAITSIKMPQAPEAPEMPEMPEKPEMPQ